MIRRFSTLAPAGLDHRRRPISDDLAHRVADLGRVILHSDHGVGAHRSGVLDHSVDRVPTRVFEQLSVFGDLTDAQRAQPGHDVYAEVAAADNKAENLAFHLQHTKYRDVLCIDVATLRSTPPLLSLSLP